MNSSPLSDPQGTRTDAELISALQRSWLLPRDGSNDSVADAKFGLDASIGDEGSNYSAGEKQLLALCRALVKNSRIIVLVSDVPANPFLVFLLIISAQDEATSNVDVETDAKLQKTIQTEFTSSTLLCIAHRLNTIGMLTHPYLFFCLDTCLAHQKYSLLRSHPGYGRRSCC
jgi:ATP-binding cassette, subfamily C (CFTR/MRP), member 1